MVAVVGVPDDRMGEVGKAFVVLRPDAHTDQAALIAWSRDNMANYKVPKVVTFHATLPREDTGKIFKRRLRDPYWAGRDRRI